MTERDATEEEVEAVKRELSSGHHYRPSEKRVPVGSTVVLESGAKVVLIERHGAHGDGTWGLPGGWVDPGEDPAEAAAREAWEEVGLTLNVLRVRFVGYTADHHPEGFSAVTMFFHCDAWSGKLRNANPARIRDVKMWSLDELRGGRGPGKLFVPLLNGIAKGLL